MKFASCFPSDQHRVESPLSPVCGYVHHWWTLFANLMLSGLTDNCLQGTLIEYANARLSSPKPTVEDGGRDRVPLGVVATRIVHK